MDLSLTWPLDANVLRLQDLKDLALANNAEPYWFGLGFIQLKLSDRYRIHFWLPEIPHPEREEIHNHRYDFTSTVLAGELVHQVYHVEKHEGCFRNVYQEMKHFEIFETDCSPSKEGTVEKVTPVNILTMGTYHLSAGTEYTFPFCSFHTTELTKWAVTFLRRWPRMLEHASVVREKGKGSVCPFRDKMSPGACWAFIELALERAQMEGRLGGGFVRDLLKRNG